MTAPAIPPAIERFIESLPREGWRLSRYGVIRRRDCCPLTVGTDDPSWLWLSCSERLGFNRIEARQIVAAADHPTPGDSTSRAIRARLLEHCGLEEK